MFINKNLLLVLIIYLVQEAKYAIKIDLKLSEAWLKEKYKFSLLIHKILNK